MMTQTENTTASAGLPAALIVILAGRGRRPALGALLTAETTAVVLTLLAVMGAGFALMQMPRSKPSSAPFTRRTGYSHGAGTGHRADPPFSGQQHLCAASCHRGAALFGAGSGAELSAWLGQYPDFATGATYGIGAYTSGLLAINFGWSLWVHAAGGGAGRHGLRLSAGHPVDAHPRQLSGAGHYRLWHRHPPASEQFRLDGRRERAGWHSGAQPVRPFLHAADRGAGLPAASRQANFYYLAASLLGLAILSAKRLHKAASGWPGTRSAPMSWRRARRHQRRHGTKILAFAVDAFLAAFAGTIYAFYVSYISPDNFTFLVSTSC